MNTNLPLEQLILTLLALAEAAPELSAEGQAALLALSEELRAERAEIDASDEASLVELLSLTQFDIVEQLYDEPAFREAASAWDAQKPVRVGLSVEQLNEKLTNPGEQRSEGVVVLTEIVQQGLQKPQELAQNKGILAQLSALVGGIWPRRRE